VRPGSKVVLTGGMDLNAVSFVKPDGSVVVQM